MVIGERIRELREKNGLSQGDIEERSGLLRCYLSRVENGHTLPSIETLEKLARALEVPLYQLFYDGEEAPELSDLLETKTGALVVEVSRAKDARFLNCITQLLERLSANDRTMLLHVAERMGER